MNIEPKEYKITMSYGELWGIAFDLEKAFLDSVKTHWVNHQDRWEENEKERLGVIKLMFYNLARPELYSIMLEKAEKIIQDFNKSRPVAAKPQL